MFIFFAFLGCLTAGTHGSLKAFEFSVPKNVLQAKVEEVIQQNPRIVVAPITDTFNSRYYNDGIRYTTINIANAKDTLKYTFQYVDTDAYWDTSKTSEIFIAYAFDQAGNGGSEASNNFHWYNPKTRQRLIDVFEKELISPLKVRIRSTRK
jgi:hypothetical protein